MKPTYYELSYLSENEEKFLSKGCTEDIVTLIEIMNEFLAHNDGVSEATLYFYPCEEHKEQ